MVRVKRSGPRPGGMLGERDILRLGAMVHVAPLLTNKSSKYIIFALCRVRNIGFGVYLNQNSNFELDIFN